MLIWSHVSLAGRGSVGGGMDSSGVWAGQPQEGRGWRVRGHTRGQSCGLHPKQMRTTEPHEHTSHLWQGGCSGCLFHQWWVINKQPTVNQEFRLFPVLNPIEWLTGLLDTWSVFGNGAAKNILLLSLFFLLYKTITHYLKREINKIHR